MNRWTLLVLAASPAFAGCWLVVGESFTGYTSAQADASASSGGDAEGGGAGDARGEDAGDARGEAAGDAQGDGAGDAAVGSCAPPCTGADMICDPGDNKCKLDGTTSKIGAPCRIDGDADTMCGTAPGNKCKESGNDGFPGGYCTIMPCGQTALCPKGATCADLTGESAAACYKICTSNDDCRTLEDYSCFELGRLYTSGAGTKICHPNRFSCNTASDCPPAKPKCSADPEAGTAGLCNP